MHQEVALLRRTASTGRAEKELPTMGGYLLLQLLPNHPLDSRSLPRMPRSCVGSPKAI